MVAFVGLDLAWTARNASGVCILLGEGERLALFLLRCQVDTAAGFAGLLESLGDDVVAAVDAPLVVADGRRAEAELARVFGRYGAYAYSARPAFLEKMDGLAGPRLGAELHARSWQLDPLRLQPQARGRFAFETYPHAAHVAHFGLRTILQYKKGPLESRRAGLRAYQQHLRTLLRRLAPTLLADPPIAHLLEPARVQCGGREVKAVEDRLDAITCALMAVAAWREGLAAGDVFGRPESGCIAIPDAQAVRERAGSSSPAAPRPQDGQFPAPT